MQNHAILKLSLATVLLVAAVISFQELPLRKDILSQIWSLNQLHYFEFKRKLKARALPAIDSRFAFTASDSTSTLPSANLSGGFYDEPVSVALHVDNPQSVIYYTLDGSIPTRLSQKYRGPIRIAQTIVLRFRTFRSNYLPSPVVTHTYLIAEDLRLPVLSLVADPSTLWNKYSGIYANRYKKGKKWEREAHVEYFESRSSSPLRMPAELRVHGGYSRSKPKKSLRLRYSLSMVQDSEVHCLLTRDSPLAERTVILRAGGSNVQYRLRDELFHTLYAQVGGLVSSYSPFMLFINGKLWGIYNLRERIDEEYFLRNLGPDSYDVIPNQGTPARAILGDKRHWERTLDFLSSHDLSDEDAFQKASQLIDVHNFTDYWLFNIYAANMDWPHTNGMAFRNKANGDGRWRWVSWDADATFRPRTKRGQGVFHNTIAWATRAGFRHDLRYNSQAGRRDTEEMVRSTLIARALLQNETYRQMFVRRFCDLLNCYLRPEDVESKLLDIIEKSRHDLPRDWQRWSISEENYWQNVEEIREFIRKRPDIILGYFRSKFQLGRLLTVKLSNIPEGAGDIWIDTIRPETNPWTGRYFEDCGIRLVAKPRPGFRFVRWADVSLGVDSEITVKLDKNMEIRAVYARVP